eukprot:318345_1
MICTYFGRQCIVLHTGFLRIDMCQLSPIVLDCITLLAHEMVHKAIISGGVLERMKNKAYIIWCMLTILVNYSFISHWVWNPNGWLNALDFVDGAGSVVVHSTAGMSALIGIWKLGMRKESLDKQGHLKPRLHSSKPIIHAVGA